MRNYRIQRNWTMNFYKVYQQDSAFRIPRRSAWMLRARAISKHAHSYMLGKINVSQSICVYLLLLSIIITPVYDLCVCVCVCVVSFVSSSESRPAPLQSPPSDLQQQWQLALEKVRGSLLSLPEHDQVAASSSSHISSAPLKTASYSQQEIYAFLRVVVDHYHAACNTSWMLPDPVLPPLQISPPSLVSNAESVPHPRQASKDSISHVISPASLSNRNASKQRSIFDELVEVNVCLICFLCLSMLNNVLRGFSDKQTKRSLYSTSLSLSLSPLSRSLPNRLRFFFHHALIVFLSGAARRSSAEPKPGLG